MTEENKQDEKKKQCVVLNVQKNLYIYSIILDRSVGRSADC